MSLIVLVMACKDGKNTAQEAEKEKKDPRIFVTNEQFEKNAMELVVAEQMDFPTLITTNGIIDVPPQNKAVVTAIMGGYVKSIPFLRGDKVRKGQPLLYIEN